MNNTNPFVPKGSLLDQQSQRRSRLKLAVFCVLAVSVTGLTAMLIQGCKREKPPEDLTSMIDTNTPLLAETNPPVLDTNIPVYNPPTTVSNTAVIPVPPITPVVEPPITEGSEYKVAKGDTLEKIAKNHGVTLKALKAANPNVKPTKMKIGDKLTIPAGGKPAAEVGAASVAPVTSEAANTETYKIKAGDTLTKIAKAHGTTVKAIQAANNLTTTKISVGKALKIPVKAAAVPTAPVTPVVETMPSPPVASPAPALPTAVK
jgi:LysM repeat protein